MDIPIIFPITYKCNLFCVYCHERLKKTEIDIEKSINTIKSLPNEWVFITGGEPLILDNIFEICDRLRSIGKKVALTTNGTINKPDIIHHIDRIGVSIDGPEDITDTNRGVGTFKKATEFLKNISGVEKGLMCTVDKWNIYRQPEIEAVGQECGCDFVQLNPVS